jgi:hypothetical protein
VVFPDFEEFIACLNAERVRFMVVGAYAVGFHGHPRATKDLDVLVEPERENARRVLRALATFLGTSRGITEIKLTNPRTLIVLGVAPIRIDILTSIDGILSFDAAYRRRARGSLGEVGASYLGLSDLLKAKRASGRLQDLADVAALENLKKPPVDKAKRRGRKP